MPLLPPGAWNDFEPLPQGLIVRQPMLLPFSGTELWCEELDALGRHESLVQKKLAYSLAHWLPKPAPSLCTVHLKDTKVPAGLAAFVAGQVCAAGCFRKVAFVGLKPVERLRQKRALKQPGAAFQYAFFSDYELAKRWLAGRPAEGIGKCQQ